MSGTTQRRRRTASATVAGTGSRATSTAASYGFPPRSKCSCASNTASGPDNCDGSTVSEHHVERHAVAAGSLQLSDAIARWWVLDDDHHARRREASLWASTGHAAAVFGDELYDVVARTRGGYGRLQDFGIRFGYERVVLHLQPRVEAGRLESNTARTRLLLEHEPLPWTRWGEEFAAALPAEILRLQERAASADGVPRRKGSRRATARERQVTSKTKPPATTPRGTS
jgi:hypothetical protein